MATPSETSDGDDAPDEIDPAETGTDQVDDEVAATTAVIDPPSADTAGYRRLTEQDYGAWANRMRQRRRSEIDALYDDPDGS